MDLRQDLRNPVWDYFTVFENGTYTCKRCDTKSFNAPPNTTNAKRHLERFHKEAYAELLPRLNAEKSPLAKEKAVGTSGTRRWSTSSVVRTTSPASLTPAETLALEIFAKYQESKRSNEAMEGAHEDGMSRLEPEDKLAFLKLILENKELLFAKTSPDTVKAKAECWEKVRSQCIAMGHTEFASKSAQFLRETTWQNLRRRAMAKLEKSVKAGSQVHFNEIDHLVFQIVGFNADGLNGSFSEHGFQHSLSDDDEKGFAMPQTNMHSSAGTSASSPETAANKFQLDECAIVDEHHFGNASRATTSRKSTNVMDAFNEPDQTFAMVTPDSFQNTIMELLKSAQVDNTASTVINGTEPLVNGSSATKRKRTEADLDSDADVEVEAKRTRLQLLRDQRERSLLELEILREQHRELQLKNRILELDIHKRELQMKSATDLLREK